MLDEFRSTNITWDKATSRIYSPVTANASDENGRKLVVQVVNSGQVEDLTGATLHLYWETRDKAHDGLDVFKAVDLKKGEFELSYTTGMLSNKGVLNANLVLIDTVGRVVSERFKITVTEGIDNDAIQSENSFTTLTQALIDISNLEQNYAPRLNDLTAQLQQTEQEITRKRKLEDLDSEVLSAIEGGEGTTFNVLSVPQDDSVLYSKLGDSLKKMLYERKSFGVGFKTGQVNQTTGTLEQNYRTLIMNNHVPMGKGIVIGLSNYTTYKFTVHWYGADGEYVSSEPTWYTEDFVKTNDLMGRVVLAYADDRLMTTPEQISELSSKLFYAEPKPEKTEEEIRNARTTGEGVQVSSLSDRLSADYNHLHSKIGQAETHSVVDIGNFYPNVRDVFPTNFQRQSTEPVLTAAKLGIGEIAFPTVINMSKYLTNPIDKYYLYLSPHNSPGGVHLLTAPHPTGPWTYHDLIIATSDLNADNHISSMDVIYVPEKQLFYGYLHAAWVEGVEGQATWLLTSNDGVNWDVYGNNPVMPVRIVSYVHWSLSYVRVFRVGGKWFAFGQAEDGGGARQCWLHSNDGISWTHDANAPLDATALGFPSRTTYSSCLLMVGQTLYAFVTVPNMQSNDTSRSIYLLRYEDGIFELAQESPVLSPSQSGWDSEKVEYPFALVEGDTIYLYYLGSVGEYYPSKLGLATVKVGKQ